MNTQMINTNDELTFDQLEDVSGGIPPALGLLGVAAGVTVGGLGAWYFKDSISAAADKISSMFSGDGVMANEDGSDCTGGDPIDFG
ncbi:MAG: class IIb bacteriocin, lactobin A/cerein 7B family [Cyanobacteria bacterium P01_F01_bin.42]